MKWERAVCTVGKEVENGRELLGPGRMAYITPESEVAPGTLLESGHKLVIDAELREWGGAPEMVVLRARRFAPCDEDMDDVAALHAMLTGTVLEELRVQGEPAEFLKAQYAAALTSGPSSAPTVRDVLLEGLDDLSRRFPMVSWDDAEGATSEMEEALRSLGVNVEFDLERVDAFDDSLREREDDEQVIRRELCGKLASLANDILSASDVEDRFFPFGEDPHDEEEPLWLCLPPAVAQALLELSWLRPPGPIELKFRS